MASIARTSTGLEGAILIHPDGTVVTGTGTGGGGSTSVWSASDAAANGMTLSNGGLTVTGNPTGWNTTRTASGKSSGKAYVEFLLNTVPPDGLTIFGIADSTSSPTTYLGNTGNSAGANTNGTQGTSGAITPYYGIGAVTLALNDVWAYAFDFDVGKFWVARNNVWFGSGNPATGANQMASWAGLTLYPALSLDTAGKWTLQSTAASQKYAPPSGFSAWDSAAPTNSPQALAYLARTVGGDEGGNGANIATLIDGLVSDGVWAKLDALYVLAQQNQSDALLNLVGTSYGLTSGLLAKPGPRALTFVPYVGFSGFANGLDTGFNPATATSPKFIQNSASFGVWAYSATANTAGQIGNNDAGSTGESHIYDNLSGTFYARVNAPSTPGVTSPGTPGWYVADRSSSASIAPYYNGAALAVQSGVSQVPYSATFKIGQGGSGTSSTVQTISAAFIGASLGAAGQLALYNRLRTYMTAIGVP